jgi:deoxycytidylate deaminase
MTDEDCFRLAGEVARKALCLRAKCGSIIVKDGEVIGEGYNAPPLDKIEDQRCLIEYELPQKFKYDRTCCIHAEWRAVINAFKKHPEKIVGSDLYFMRLNDQGEMTRAGVPFCTECSRIALDAGVARFFLWHEDGIKGYDAHEYNELSYAYTGGVK